ncbi:hypothetical protein PMAYCL1PPCAC_12001, partial [Pristionchus mayeri]
YLDGEETLNCDAAPRAQCIPSGEILILDSLEIFAQQGHNHVADVSTFRCSVQKRHVRLVAAFVDLAECRLLR